MDFQKSLIAFNQMYGLPVNEQPTYLGLQRLKDLKEILIKEVNEIDDIIEHASLDKSQGFSEMEVFVALADLMGDLQVYCGSEMTKWGLPLEAVLYIIMASNMSKLGADGKPIVNAQGKVEKGPHYWKPEPLIKDLLKYGGGLDNGFAMVTAMQLVVAKQAELAGGATTPAA